MKNNIKFLLIGLIIGVIIATSSVFALTGSVQKNLNYNNIKITLNGEEITPTDANGNYVEPFTIDGTTYLPVRAIANALSLDVNWNGETNTVVLGKDTSSSSDGTVLYDENNIKITYIGKSQIFSDTYDISIENNSDKTIFISLYDFYANDFTMGSFSGQGETINPGKKAGRHINCQPNIIAMSGLSYVEKIEFKLDIRDAENTTDIIEKDKLITIRP